MTNAPLHLVDRDGLPVSIELALAVKAAYAWARWQFALIDTALLANWAERVALSMSEKAVQSPRRYAIAALHGKVREFYRAGGIREISVGASQDLEALAGVDGRPTKMMERSILFDQLTTQLNDRDRVILVLLRQDVTSPADMADALGVSYDAAAKAIQRVRERLRDILMETSQVGLRKGDGA